MDASQWLSFVLYLGISWIFGTILNLMIVTIYMQERRWHVVLCDQITGIISLMNVVLQFTLTLDGILQLFGLYPLLPEKLYLFVLFFIFFLVDTGSWHTSWLAISYSIRLVSLSHRFFIWLQSHFPSSAFPLLVASALGSFLINIPLFVTTRAKLLDFASNQSSAAMYVPELSPSVILIHFAFGCCLPLILTLTCIGLSVRVLLGHVWMMRLSSSEYGFAPQLQALVGAAGTMILQGLLELVFNLLMTGVISTSFSIIETSQELWEAPD